MQPSTGIFVDAVVTSKTLSKLKCSGFAVLLDSVTFEYTSFEEVFPFTNAEIGVFLMNYRIAVN